VPEVACLGYDAWQRAHPAHVAFRAFDARVKRVMKGLRFFRVHVVADASAKLHAVGVLPHLNADEAQYGKTYNECAPNEQRSPGSGVFGIEDLSYPGHKHLLVHIRSYLVMELRLAAISQFQMDTS
jgi:hypothetical protein